MCTYHIHTQQRANFKNQIQQPRITSSTFREISRLTSRLLRTEKSISKKKIKQIKTIRKSMYWLTSRNSKLSVKNKLLIYKIIIKPIWTYGLQIWGMATKSNIKKIENLQSKILRTISNAQWYVRNDDIRKTLGIQIIKEEILKRARTHQHKIKNHRNR